MLEIPSFTRKMGGVYQGPARYEELCHILLLQRYREVTGQDIADRLQNCAHAVSERIAKAPHRVKFTDPIETELARIPPEMRDEIIWQSRDGTNHIRKYFPSYVVKNREPVWYLHLLSGYLTNAMLQRERVQDWYLQKTTASWEAKAEMREDGRLVHTRIVLNSSIHRREQELADTVMDALGHSNLARGGIRDVPDVSAKLLEDTCALVAKGMANHVRRDKYLPPPKPLFRWGGEKERVKN